SLSDKPADGIGRDAERAGAERSDECGALGCQAGHFGAVGAVTELVRRFLGLEVVAVERDGFLCLLANGLLAGGDRDAAGGDLLLRHETPRLAPVDFDLEAVQQLLHGLFVLLVAVSGCLELVRTRLQTFLEHCERLSEVAEQLGVLLFDDQADDAPGFVTDIGLVEKAGDLAGGVLVPRQFVPVAAEFIAVDSESAHVPLLVTANAPPWLYFPTGRLD